MAKLTNTKIETKTVLLGLDVRLHPRELNLLVALIGQTKPQLIVDILDESYKGLLHDMYYELRGIQDDLSEFEVE